MIRWTFLALNVVAHPMEIARALPGSPVTPNMVVFIVLSDMLNGSFSNYRCASDGASSSSN
eukprot:93755-Heterocapsa_arctica.AAC.1